MNTKTQWFVIETGAVIGAGLLTLAILTLRKFGGS